MYLEAILGSGTKIKIFNTLIRESPLIERDLALKSGSSFSEVNRQIRDLTQLGIVRVNKVGRSSEYSINKEHFLFNDLKRLFRDLNEYYMKAAKEIVGYITKKHKIDTVIIIGSVAERRATRESDIDLIFICEGKLVKQINEELISFINTQILNKYGFLCYPIVLSREEYLQRLKKDHFIIKAHAEGVVLYGEKPRKFS